MINPTFYPRSIKFMQMHRQMEPFDLVGYTPWFLSLADPDDAVSQLHKHYDHGGGWHDFKGFTLRNWDSETPTLTYPDDPPTEAVAYWQLRDERVILFDHAWVAVVQPDGSFRISRMD